MKNCVAKIPRLAAIIFICGFLIVGCKPSDVKSPKSTKLSEVGAKDPLSAFKIIAERCFLSLVESDAIQPGKSEGYIRVKIHAIQKEYDVKKPTLSYLHLLP